MSRHRDHDSERVKTRDRILLDDGLVNLKDCIITEQHKN